MTTIEIPISPRHRAAWILYQLSIHGSSFAEVAKDVGVTRQAVRNTAFFLHSPRIEQAIAKVIGRAPKDVWPERYPPHAVGQPRASA